MPGPVHSDQTDVEGLHLPKGFSSASTDTALIKDIAGNLEYRELALLGGTGAVGPAGPSLSAWTTATDYIIGNTLYSDVVDSTENRIYRCIVSHTSGASLLLDIANWTELSEQNPFAEDDTARMALSTFRISGFILSVNVDPTKVNLSAGLGINVDNTTTPGTPIVTIINEPEKLGISIINIGTQSFTPFSIDVNGDPIQRGQTLTPSQRRDEFQIGSAVHTDLANVTQVVTNFSSAYDTAAKLKDFMDAVGFFITSGNEVSGVSGTLSFQKSSGTGFLDGINPDPKDPTSAPLPALPVVSFFALKQDGVIYAATALLDPTTYDNAGTITTVPNNNNATINYIYLFATNQMTVLKGQEVFSSLSDAIDAAGTETVIIPSVLRTAILIARVITTKTSTDTTNNSTTRFLPTGAAASGAAGTPTSTQLSYDVSIQPQVVLNSTLGAMQYRDAVIPIGAPLHQVQNNDGTVSYLSVEATGVKTETQAYSDLNVLADAATVNTDCGDGNVHAVVLGGNRTLGAPTNLKPGATYIWYLIQDSTGSRTLSYNAIFKFPGDIAPVLVGTSNKLQILSGVSRGGNIHVNLSEEYTA